MAVRNWDTLSDTYRRRLERAGVTRRAYERGASLEKARGHSQTPEHPERAIRNQEKYRRYLIKHQRQGGQVGGWSGLRIAVFNRMVRELFPYLEQRFQPEIRRPTFRWSYQNIYERLGNPRNPETGELWNKTLMRRFLDMHDTDFDQINWRDPEWSFLWYH